MSWINQPKRVWRTAELLILMGAITGPWGWDQINVPAQYPCSAPFFRLEGDFCGLPLSGLWLVSELAPAMVMNLFREGTGFMDRFGPFAVGMLLLFPVLPFLSALILILLGERPRRQMFHIVALGLAAGMALLLGMPGISRMGWASWGIWLYAGLAGGALLLEVFVLVRREEPRPG